MFKCAPVVVILFLKFVSNTDCSDTQSNNNASFIYIRAPSSGSNGSVREDGPFGPRQQKQDRSADLKLFLNKWGFSITQV